MKHRHIVVTVFAVICVLQPAAMGLRSSTRDQQVAAAAEALRTKLVEQRRDFHMHPELSNREERTSRIVAERLRALGLDEVKTGVGKFGVVALLKGSKPGPVVAVRADMDALPIQETIDVPYKSLNPGVKHACGHDAHTTIELGVAEVLSKMRNEISGSIKFIFQPAEEGAPQGEQGGAALMVKEGALENPRPSVIFGLHTMPSIEAGQIAYHTGPAMASSDRFTITIRGKKSHGAQPQLGVDAVVAAGVRFVTLTYGGWDMHNAIVQGFRGQMPAFDQAFSALINDLDRTGLLNETVVMVSSEFGRTPKINATAGRDHWPKVFSVVLAGGGIKRGSIYGLSNSTASEPEDNPLGPEDLFYTLYNCLGIVGDKELMAPGDRPIEIIDGGKVRKELLA
jgi:hypothetical protein